MEVSECLVGARAELRVGGDRVRMSVGAGNSDGCEVQQVTNLS